MPGPLGFGGGGGGDGNILPSVTAGTGISVSGTTGLTISATGIQSLSAGTGISVSGTTTPTVTNSGVTSIVAGTNVTVSGATGAVTINATGGSVSYGSPSSLVIGGSNTAGSATSVTRSDHVHAFPAGGAPSALAITSTQSTGSSTAPALADHVHAMPGFGTPVNIDASLTSLSAGSLTTVARADHVHTVSKVPVLLASSTVSVDVASVSLTIPGGYQALGVRVIGRVAGPYANGVIAARFNSDAGANYYNASTGTLTNYCYIGHCNGGGNYFAQPSITDFHLANYADTTYYKVSGTSSSWWNNSTTGYNAQNWASAWGMWNSTSAITSILIYEVGSYNIKAGTILRIYGYP